ncbi:type IV toxin-antitoxin system AbiEi family antitoxin [Vibrio sp. JC009]|uniref:type IV toxin-antitoxin system AbiEi family antitoxin n=1 Tax=Vibrio sp. JC009 TaxID=2912314 RepID=UPI0023B16A51|nr:type IV toxin-antitoxin system AbiEi family antitoxin [Vibrio sp. JC009]WED24006.1 type IV toxin-antitoxin system AbiEi family antitoxin [Vibrio sp. JC009]
MNNQSKINWLVNHTAPGSLVLQPWLVENGISHSLTQRYAQSGWLYRLMNGVYYRPDMKTNRQPDWADALQALSEQLHFDIHLSGLTSLTYQGLSHYLVLSSEKVWVGTKEKASLPKWFREFPNQEWLYCRNSRLSEVTEKDFTVLVVDGKELTASSPELAAYEVVDAIGKHISFEHAAELFQGLVNLSPRKVQSLLNRSKAVQTNRVFLYLGHHHDHQWVKRLDETQIELGSGKRQVVPNGRYDEKYKITVPESLSIR